MARAPKRQLNPDAIHLDGPSEPTVTLPPARRAGPAVVMTAVALLFVAGLVTVVLVRPDLFTTAVQAFSLRGSS